MKKHSHKVNMDTTAILKAFSLKGCSLYTSLLLQQTSLLVHEILYQRR